MLPVGENERDLKDVGREGEHMDDETLLVQRKVEILVMVQLD